MGSRRAGHAHRRAAALDHSAGARVRQPQPVTGDSAERHARLRHHADRRVVILTALRRGISKRCPHCGKGPLFSGWAHHVERCSVCGLVYERNPGDAWAVTIIGDRLPIAAIIVLIYFGYGRTHHVVGLLTFALLGVIVVVTAPNRWGVGIALHYLSRVYWPDPSDPVPKMIDHGGTASQR